MKRALVLALLLAVSMMLPPPRAASAEERIVLTIGDVNDRSTRRIDGENQLGMWRYLEELLGVEIQYVYLSAEDYASLVFLSTAFWPRIQKPDGFAGLPVFSVRFHAFPATSAMNRFLLQLQVEENGSPMGCDTPCLLKRL